MKFSLWSIREWSRIECRIGFCSDCWRTTLFRRLCCSGVTRFASLIMCSILLFTSVRIGNFISTSGFTGFLLSCMCPFPIISPLLLISLFCSLTVVSILLSPFDSLAIKTLYSIELDSIFQVYKLDAS